MHILKRVMLCASALVVMATASQAQQVIGNATTVERDVRGNVGGAERAVGAGDDVFAREAITTAEESSTNLTFRDATSIVIGPLARVVLDRFVYNPDGSARRSVLAAAKGALRWTSGQSDPRAYQVRTPLAAIGVRGTQFDLVVEDAQETVILRDGQVNVCLKGTSNCKSLINPGDVAYITPAGISTAPRNAPSPQDFASNCLAGGGPCAIDPAGPSIVSLPAPALLGGVPLSGFRISLTTQTEVQKMGSRYDGSPDFQDSIELNNVPNQQGDKIVTQSFGVNVGYDFRSGPIIFGIETDASFTPFDCRTLDQSVRNFSFSTGNGTQNVRITSETASQVNAQMSVRGKLGFAVTDQLSLYGIGGVMLANTTESLSVVNNLAVTNQLYRGSDTKWRVGYVIGAGAEYMFTPNIGAMVEYSHYDLGKSTLRVEESARGGATTTGNFATTTNWMRGHIIKTGVTFRF
jgi:opacity protein-like surface antigen